MSRWATRRGIHIDRASSAWLIRRFIAPRGAVRVRGRSRGGSGRCHPVRHVRGRPLHHGSDCTFETLLRRYELHDPALWRLAQVIHEADIDDGLYDAPEAPGIDVALRGLSMVASDDDILRTTRPMFDGTYEFFRRQLLLGREPA